MKKKIILLLCFIMVTVILTGCSSKNNVDEAEIERMTEIANHIASGEECYRVPEEYEATYVDKNVNRRICIKKVIKSEVTEATFDISLQEPTLIKAKKYNYVVKYSSYCTIGFILLFGFFALIRKITEG